MKEVSAEVVIQAPAERVWEVLTDFAKFPEWNPFIKKMSGEPRTGARLEVRIEPPGGRAMTFRPKMVNVETNREMCWLGKLWIPGLFNGEHCFTIEAFDEKGVRFVQHERFTGLLVPFMAKSLDRDTKSGFEAMNRALKERAENCPRSLGIHSRIDQYKLPIGHGHEEERESGSLFFPILGIRYRTRRNGFLGY